MFNITNTKLFLSQSFENKISEIETYVNTFKITHQNNSTAIKVTTIFSDVLQMILHFLDMDGGSTDSNSLLSDGRQLLPFDPIGFLVWVVFAPIIKAVSIEFIIPILKVLFGGTLLLFLILSNTFPIG